MAQFPDRRGRLGLHAFVLGLDHPLRSILAFRPVRQRHRGHPHARPQALMGIRRLSSALRLLRRRRPVKSIL